MTSHELFAAMPPALATEIIEYTFTNDKNLYRAALDAVAQSRKVRPVFLERQPRAQRFAVMAASLSRAPLQMIADSLIRVWLLKKQSALLIDFLDALKIPHEKGAVENLPPSVDDAVLTNAVEGLLAKYPPESVALYLHAFNDMNDARFSNLDALLQTDARLNLKREGGGPQSVVSEH